MAKIHPYPTPKGRSPKEIEGPTNDQPILTGKILLIRNDSLD